MAQRTENEEAEFKVVPENIKLCVKCGGAGNYASATNNSCQKCLNTTADVSTSAAVVTPTAAIVAKSMKSQTFRSSSSARFSPERSLILPITGGDLKKEVSTAAAPLKREATINPIVMTAATIINPPDERRSRGRIRWSKPRK